MKNVIIAPVGGSMDALFVGVREFSTERVILIATEKMMQQAKHTKSELGKFKIPAMIKEIKGEGSMWENIFETIAQIKKVENDSNILLNVATGGPELQCIATSAAFVNGLKAFDVMGNDAMLLPILKFSYYKMLTDKKLSILKILNRPDCCASLEEVSKKTGMSLPLISYHINGTLKSDGLKDLGLVKTTEKKGKVQVTLTTLGRLLIKGYV